ncbi:aromatic amino acid DMT transporter YddG [Pseudomonas syringae]|uniref:aromatic amino acid DMT transporter YddG n=1 Tax=Pseudomonas syringae TaxID=317 RepID=UPI0018E6455E|nr:aromatic amino acid DMT transporter YddG [Pseudomonas syringae]MBI6750760.1 aromatic amino acid DMT transporter YddG [Pseudomonas syringae]MBI6770543.1 aromatic amino acid DMT transporter YddG [Pseudomonas syringae]MBI6774095.1 aromatic amino acid DMT transporter YddG [Pseudomonas syringae]MBI6790875.1 aromatic amino acid DMT transporter YddG [Pseudomonas syringae]MBI6803724.1 aromatic amino acid DMT transporter YddG [Pseudomonas syringae]
MKIESERAATLCGLTAILLWSTASGLIRSVSMDFGPIGGAALIYTLGSFLLLLIFGRPRIRRTPRMYLLLGSALFVAYELCLSLALGYAINSTQAIQLNVVNNLWPCLTVLLAILMNGQRARWMIVPGSALALAGILWVVSTEGLSISSIIDNIKSSPISFSLAGGCAITFALYCNVTRRYAGGQNLVALFFTLTATILWIKYALSDESISPRGLPAVFELLAAGIAMAGGYALWNIGVLRGNLTLMATASYSTPVLSSAFAGMWLGAQLTSQFWQGALLVTVGSLMCWFATRR